MGKMKTNTKTNTQLYEADEFEKHVGLVKNIASRFMGRGVEYEDLVQIGSIGLVKAIRNFDPTTENAFSTYAVPLIMGEIRRYFRDNGPIKVSRKIQADMRCTRNYIRVFHEKNMREPDVSEIVQGTGLCYEEVVMALNANAGTVSLTPDEDGSEIQILDRTAEGKIGLVELMEIIEKLEDEERLLIHLRFFKGLTQMQTAKILGSTQVKISRLEKKTKEKLKAELNYNNYW